MEKARPFKNEADVRRLITSRISHYRIESAIGGTDGLPDLFWAHRTNKGRYGVPSAALTIYAETKAAPLRKSGIVDITIRPSQRRTLLRMMTDCLPALIVVGIIGTNRLFAMGINNESVSGPLLLSRLVEANWSREILADDYEWMLDDLAEHAIACATKVHGIQNSVNFSRPGSGTAGRARRLKEGDDGENLG